MPDHQGSHYASLRRLRNIGFMLFDIALGLVAYLTIQLAASLYCEVGTFYVTSATKCACCAVNDEYYRQTGNVLRVLAVWAVPILLLGTLIGRFVLPYQWRIVLSSVNLGLILFALSALVLRTVMIAAG